MRRGLALILLAAGACRGSVSHLALDGPPQVAISGFPRSVHVAWTAVAGASGYAVYDKKGSAPTRSVFDHRTLITATQFVVGNLLPNDVDFVSIAPIIGTGEADLTPAISAVVLFDIMPQAIVWNLDGAVSGGKLGTALALADLDGDGFDDAIVGEPGFATGAGRIRVFRGGVAGISSSFGFAVGGAGAALGTSLAALGDGAVAAGEPGTASAQVFAGPALSPVSAFAGTATSVSFGASMAPVLRAGGIALAVGDPGWNAGAGRVAIVNTNGATLAVLPGTAASHAGTAVASGALQSIDLLLSGAPDTTSGTAFAFVSTSGTPVWQPGNSQNGDRQGAAVCVLGDLTADGRSEIAIGAPGADGNGNKAGLVRVFSSRPGTPPWSTNNSDQQLQGNNDNSGFGSSLVTGDFTGDGRPDLLVGEPAFQGGEVNLFAASGALFDSQNPDRLPTTHPGASYGAAMAVGDANGDGFPDLLIGAPTDSTGAAGGGHVELRLGSPHASPILTLGGPQTATAGVALVFSNALITDSSTALATCTWSFGDQTPDVVISPCSASNVALSHTWAQPGSFFTTLRISVLDGRDAMVTAPVRVSAP